MLRRTRWRPGPAEGFEGGVLVSVTEYTANRWRDLPGVWLRGLRLARAWPEMQGAVGMWLWAEPLARRSGAISIWRSEDDLRRFVRWPVHLAIVRKYRPRGRLHASSWRAERFDEHEVLRRAMQLLVR